MAGIAGNQGYQGIEMSREQVEHAFTRMLSNADLKDVVPNYDDVNLARTVTIRLPLQIRSEGHDATVLQFAPLVAPPGKLASASEVLDAKAYGAIGVLHAGRALPLPANLEIPPGIYLVLARDHRIHFASADRREADWPSAAATLRELKRTDARPDVCVSRNQIFTSFEVGQISSAPSFVLALTHEEQQMLSREMGECANALKAVLIKEAGQGASLDAQRAIPDVVESPEYSAEQRIHFIAAPRASVGNTIENGTVVGAIRIYAPRAGSELHFGGASIRVDEGRHALDFLVKAVRHNGAWQADLLPPNGPNANVKPISLAAELVPVIGVAEGQVSPDDEAVRLSVFIRGCCWFGFCL